MSITFDPANVASRDAVDAERAHLAPFLWPMRVLCLFASAVALWVAYAGAKSIVPVVASWLYDQDVNDWPKIAVNFIEAIQIGVLYLGTFILIAMGFLWAFFHVAHTHYFTIYWRLAALEYREKEEVLMLAEKWPAVEAYRLAVAGRRDFLRGDLEVMQTIAEKAEEAARQEAINRRLQQTDLRIRQGHSGEGK